MRIALFYHSLLSDWNHGNAHFLRGVGTELVSRGHEVRVFEPADSWSRKNLLAEHGGGPLEHFQARYPELRAFIYDDSLDFSRELDGTDLVIVHEWNRHSLVKRLGEHRARCGYRLLFHDTHHRSVTAPAAMASYDLSRYDGVLAFGEAVRAVYLRQGWAERVFTWHEAADTRVFHPMPAVNRDGDLVWIGNWGDDERSAELREFLIEPTRRLALKTCVRGVRYPQDAVDELSRAGIRYEGWLPNFEVPRVFSRFRVTVHIPRRPYATALPGIPTIRPFEAMACGIPLVSAPWEDAEGLFRPGVDYLVARDGQAMERHLLAVLNDADCAAELAHNGRETILARHTCSHRVDQLLSIYSEIAPANESLATLEYSVS
jgi:spore maturation protein CgeB